MNPTILFWDDLCVGDVFVTRSIAVTSNDIERFGTSFDRLATRVVAAADGETTISSRFARGWNAEAMTMRLLVSEVPRFAGSLSEMGGIVEWHAPAHPGDQVRVECEVVELSPLRFQVNCGLVVLKSKTLNQRDEAVLTLVARRIVRRRTSQAASKCAGDGGRRFARA